MTAFIVAVPLLLSETTKLALNDYSREKAKRVICCETACSMSNVSSSKPPRSECWRSREMPAGRRCRFRVSLDQVLAPTDDVLQGVFLVERCDQVRLTPFAKDHPSNRNTDIDLAPQQVGDGAHAGGRFGGLRTGAVREHR